MKWFLVFLTFFMIIVSVIYYSRPLIRETDTESINIDGAWMVAYRYSINGFDQCVYLSNDTELRAYRKYLSRVGRFYR